MLKNVDRKALILAAVFSLLAIAAFVALSDYYASTFPLLMGWLVVFVLAAKWLLGEDEGDDGDNGDHGEGRDGDAGGDGDDAGGGHHGH